MSRLVVHDDAAHRLGGAVPSPAVAFLLSMIALPALFWLVMLKRTTVSTEPEEWLMRTLVPAVQRWVEGNVPPLETLIVGISALGSGWFVALAFAGLGLLALARGRRDLAFLLALGTLCFPMEWALKYFTSLDAISLPTLVSAMLNVNDIGLDDIADFPAGHALRATVFYGIAAFVVARLTGNRRDGLIAYAAAAGLTVAISAIRIYLGAHFPIDVIGGWTAGMALLTIAVSWHVLQVDERVRVREREERLARRQEMLQGLRRRREEEAAGAPVERPATPRPRPRPVAQRPAREA